MRRVQPHQGPRLTSAARAAVVDLAHQHTASGMTRWAAYVLVAEQYRVTPQAVYAWVRRAEPEGDSAATPVLRRCDYSASEKAAAVADVKARLAAGGAMYATCRAVGLEMGVHERTVRQWVQRADQVRAGADAHRLVLSEGKLAQLSSGIDWMARAVRELFPGRSYSALTRDECGAVRRHAIALLEQATKRVATRASA